MGKNAHDIGDVESPEQCAVGSRAYIKRTLEQARETLAAAHGRLRGSATALDRSAELAASSERAVQESLAMRAQLRASVTAYVHRLRADAVSPEHTLTLVKSAVSEATPYDLNVAEARALMEEVVRWSIAAYFDAA